VSHHVNIAGAFAPKRVEVLSVDQWSDRYRVLDPSIAARPGPFLTSAVEVARGPMRAITEPGVKTITIASATQVMKTTVIENAVGYFIHQRPSPILVVQPHAAAAKNFGKERIAALVRASPTLRDIVAEDVTHRSLQSQTYWKFPGGFCAVEGAGSPMSLASRPIRVTLIDEADKMETTKEGDPILLAEERTSTFPDSLRIRCCSPTVDDGNIWRSYLAGDQRRPFVACPHCDHEQTLTFRDHVQWAKSPDGKTHFPETAAIVCESCGAEWSEAQRRTIMTTENAVRWYQTRPFTCCEVAQEPMKTRRWQWDSDNLVGRACCTECGKHAVSNHHASFGHVNKLYSPAGNVTVASLAEMFLSAKDDPAQRRAFYNTQLALPYESFVGRDVEVTSLLARREDFGGKIPHGVVRLTAGVDVQGDRIEVGVWGWGAGLESWSIFHEIITGNPAEDETWNRVDRLLASVFPHAAGVKMTISAACIDSGHLAQKVYEFCSNKSHRRIWCVKGASWSRKSDPVWPRAESRKHRKANRPVMIATQSAKDHLREMLLIQETGPGFVHLPRERSQAWIEQLLSEREVR
jgi:phage terminase large subunit GpA-like protein